MGRSMSTLTVTAKGQVTLRRDMLTHLGIHPGDKVVVDKLPHGRIEIRAARPTGRISDAFNFLKKQDGPSLSIDKMNKIAVRGWAGKR
jgi:bifunctional DNA-binding transcriptional regulator/antitoxin component of YhaV-PrlF toxin-antitoxin module